MKIPKHIKNSMHRVARLHSEANSEMNKVEDWLEKNGFDIDELRDGSGTSLEELDYANDVTDELCTKIENGFGKGRDGFAEY